MKTSLPINKLCFRAWCFLLGLVCCCLWSSFAHAAQTRRYAVVVGVNEGLQSDEPLRYAESDSQRIADILVSLAGVAEEDIVLLRGRSASRMEAVLSRLSTRMIQEAARDPNQEAVLIFYYSGHAGAQGLHIDGSTIPYPKLKAAIENVPAQARLIVLDACHSGDITRAKGGKPAPIFAIEDDQKLSGRGLAMITSSAVGEDSQESERFRGGVFTHHFLNGLRGAADQSGDGRVSLSEAYQYSYHNTLRSTSQAEFLQHPSYAFDLRGQRELVLTWIGRAENYGFLRVNEPGDFLIFSDHANNSQGRAGEMVAEFSSPSSATIAIPRGRYLVRRRDSAYAWEAAVLIRAKSTTTLDRSKMKKLPYGTTVRRGYNPKRKAVGEMSADFAAGRALTSDQQVGWLSALGLRIHLKEFSVQLRVRHGYEMQGPSAHLEKQQHSLGGDFALLRFFDIGRFSPGIGLRAGGDWVSQRFERENITTPVRHEMIWRVGPVAQLLYSPFSRVSFALELGLDAVILPRYQAQDESRTTLARPTPYGGLGLSVNLF